MAAEGRTFEALLRNEFRVFVHKVFATLTPGQTYVRNLARRSDRLAA